MIEMRDGVRLYTNIYLAKDADYQTAARRIYRSKRFASYVKLPVAARQPDSYASRCR